MLAATRASGEGSACERENAKEERGMTNEQPSSRSSFTAPQVPTRAGCPRFRRCRLGGRWQASYRSVEAEICFVKMEATALQFTLALNL